MWLVFRRDCFYMLAPFGGSLGGNLQSSTFLLEFLDLYLINGSRDRAGTITHPS